MKSKSKKFLPALFAAILTIGLFAAAPLLTKAAAPFNAGPRGNNIADPANSIYVSQNGNDARATGSIDNPYKSINTALAAAKPGDTIILRGGTYREGTNVRVRAPNITIKSAKGEWAVIDLSTHDPGADEDSGVYFDVDSSGGRLQSVEVIGGFYAVCMETKWDWGDPNDRNGASNIIIEDCVLHDSKYDVVKVKPNCKNVAIRYNEIYNSGRAEVNNPYWLYGEANAEGIDNVNGSNMTVQNNYIHDIGGNGIYAKGGASDVLIENNRIEHIYGAGVMAGFDASPEYFDIAVNPMYYENIRGVVRNNLIINTGWEGIGLYAAKDAQVYNNTLVNVDNGPGQYHSAIYFGLTYQDWEDYAGRPASVNPNIHHNIVCQPATFNRPMIEIRYANELGGMSALEGAPVMDSNCYYVAGKKAVFADYRPGRTLENAGLSAWQSHIGGDSGSVDADPALGSDYMPTNPKCDGMGIASSASSVSSVSSTSSTSSASSVSSASTALLTPPIGDLDSASDWARDGIKSAIAKGFVPADIQGRYTNVITRAEFCRMAVKWMEYAAGKDIDAILADKGLSRDLGAFSDTNDQDILAAYALGITSGTTAPTDTAPGVFSPNSQFTREQAATMVRNTVKAYGANVSDCPDAGYSDISIASGWAIDSINFCFANKIMTGTSTTPPAFSPWANYTREQSIITFNNINQSGLMRL